MTPNNTLAKILMQKGIVKDVQRANLISISILSIVIVICVIIIARNLLSSEPIDPEYYYDPSEDIGNT